MLTAKYLRSILNYNEFTGKFIWREGRRRAGKVAGTQHQNGQRQITINGRIYLEHRLAWLYVHGHWPKELDHKDRVRHHNWISNLREATRAQNNANMTARSNLGFKGVDVVKRNLIKRYRARVKFNGKTTYLGYFATAEEANAMYLAFMKSLHGDFASSR